MQENRARITTQSMPPGPDAAGSNSVSKQRLSVGNRRWLAVGGVLGVLCVVGLISAAALVEVAGPGQVAYATAEVEDYLPLLAGNRLYVVGQWVFIISFGLLLGFLGTLYHILQRPAAGLLLALLAAVVSTAVFMSATVMLIGIAEGVAPAYAGTPGEAAVVVANAMMQVRNHAMWVEGLFLGVAVLLFGIGQVRAMALPRWPGYLALLGGALEILGGLGALLVLHEAVRGAGFLVTLAWAFSTSIVMLRQSTRRTAAG